VALEETFHAQSQGTKRGHDDQYDPDSREGEKRCRLESSSAAAASTAQPTTTTQPEAGSSPHDVEPHVETIDPSEHDKGVTLDLNQPEGS